MSTVTLLRRCTITLLRRWPTPFGLFGRLEGNWYTVERNWRDNIPFESAIPAGTYDLKRSYYYRGGYDCYELLDVPGRTHIKIHKANCGFELYGCIAPGSELSFVNGQWAIGNSAKAFAELMTYLDNQTPPPQIRIVDPPALQTAG